MRKRFALVCICCLALVASTWSQEKKEAKPAKAEAGKFVDFFKADLSNAIYDKTAWTYKEGVLTASKDAAIWSDKEYEDFVLQLEFKNDVGTNSGVVVHCSDKENWIPNSVEIQIADDFYKKWAESPATWHCGAIFGRLAPTKSLVKKPGEWNTMEVMCKGKMIHVKVNGEQVTMMDMAKWTDAKKNPDGSEIPSWLSRPAAELTLKGFIGLQGKHGDAIITFRNVKIKELK